MTKLFYIVIAALLLAQLPLPYDIYIFIDTVAAAFFGFLSYRLFQEKDNNVAYVFLVLTIIYQPFLRISFGRIGWMLFDGLVAAALIVLVFGNRFISPDTTLGKTITRLHNTFGIN